MAKHYEISTLRDIFDKIPSDRIAVCLAEIGQVMITAKMLAEQSGTVGGIHFPLVSTWTDDGLENVGFDIVVTETGEKAATVRLSPEIDVQINDFTAAE